MLTPRLSLNPGRGVAVKRYLRYGRGEPAREWRALRLLAEHAPGLAPEPLRADLHASPPVIEMSLLPGEPLGGAPLTEDQESALVRALGQLWQSVPVDQVSPVPGEYGNEAQLVDGIHELAGEHRDVGDDLLVQTALGTGLDWLTWAVTVTGESAGRQQVFGQGDANLANFLWDGERLRIVDFEDSGRSDRALELAVLVEHISARDEAGLDGDRFVTAFDLSPAERARLADCRRLSALYWLLRLWPDSSGQAAGFDRLRRQAERLLALF